MCVCLCMCVMDAWFGRGTVHELRGVALPQGVLTGSARSIDPRHSGPPAVAIIVAVLLSWLETEKVHSDKNRPECCKKLVCFTGALSSCLSATVKVFCAVCVLAQTPLIVTIILLWTVWPWKKNSWCSLNKCWRKSPSCFWLRSWTDTAFSVLEILFHTDYCLCCSRRYIFYQWCSTTWTLCLSRPVDQDLHRFQHYAASAQGSGETQMRTYQW